ncbi:hypothetical protein [Thalassospira xiamenensis]|uniref:Uncharacterized protein n=1 Tax=Thalassospira xiamenensis TaxID=220697 RepID=A0A285RJB0_9PROT|nr:hypothetical protein [Thalassospira xiamenensis]SOB93964.1 hypothetical protein SAMN05428964_101881 [Thalassospira xiamenensis]
MKDTTNLFIRIHGMAGGQSACRVAGRARINLLSPEHAGASLGAQWFATLITGLRSDFPDAVICGILDCRGRRASALAAMESGLNAVLLDDDLPNDLKTRLENLGSKSGCQLITALPPSDQIYETGDDILPDAELDRRLSAFLAG